MQKNHFIGRKNINNKSLIILTINIYLFLILYVRLSPSDVCITQIKRLEEIILIKQTGIASN